MKNPITVREIICFAVALICAYFAFVKKYDTATLQEEKIRAEEKIKNLQHLDSTRAHYIDSLQTRATVFEGIVEYQKRNPKLIIEKYDKERSHLNVLDVDAAVQLLSDRLSKEGGH